jgi:hypothetical protein
MEQQMNYNYDFAITAGGKLPTPEIQFVNALIDKKVKITWECYFSLKLTEAMTTETPTRCHRREGSSEARLHHTHLHAARTSSVSSSR